MNHAPRFDTNDVDPVQLKPNLASFANSYFLELWLDSSMKYKIFIGSHSLECSADERRRRYTDEKTQRYDGLHFYSRLGKAAFTESVVNIMMSSVQTKPSLPKQQNNDDEPTKAQRTKYSSVVTGNKAPIRTQNRFSPLSERLGN